VGRDDTIVSPDFRIDALEERKVPLNLPQLQPLPFPEIIEKEEMDGEENGLPQESSLRTEEIATNTPSRSPQGEGGNRRRRRRRPFSKRRDQDRHRDQSQSDQNQGGSSSGVSYSKSSISIEDQIITEIIESTHKEQRKELPKAPTQEVTGEPSHQEEKGEVKADEPGRSAIGADHHRRRRRRPRRNNGEHHSQQQNKKEETSSSTGFIAEPAEKIAVFIPPSNVTDEVKWKQKPKDVTIPITSLPEGPELTSQKSTHGRWWKRLLES
jgi:hypothetical protein